MLLTPMVYFICIKNFRNFSFRKNTISDCGRSKKYGRLFNVTLGVSGILEVLFVWAIISRFSLVNQPLVTIGLILAGMFTLFASVFSKKRHELLHTVFGYAIFIIVIPWFIFLHIKLIQQDRIIGYMGSIIAILLASGTVYLYDGYKECSIPEIYFISCFATWNIFFTFALLFW